MAADPLSPEKVADLLKGVEDGLTLEVVVGQAEQSGAYLFHIGISDGGTYILRSYTGQLAKTFADAGALTRFINHAAGLAFDEDSWLISEEMNRRVEVEEEDSSRLVRAEEVTLGGEE